MTQNNNRVRARVWSTGKFRKARRGKSNGLTWHFEVLSSDGRVVLYDNTGDFGIILRDALIRVEALRHMQTAGHKLPTYGREACMSTPDL